MSSFKPLDSKCDVSHATPNKGGKRRETTLILLHYTASSTLTGSVSWLCNPQAKASAHVCVGQNGTTAQLADLDDICWHAGQSMWRGMPAVNSYSVGIEIVNLGPLVQKDHGGYVSAAGGVPVHKEDVLLGRHKNEHWPYVAWHRYTEAQRVRVLELIDLLRKKYPTIREVVGHDDVAPARKLDPGPAAPPEWLHYEPLHV